MLDWLREAATPPPGVELFSADGAVFTGIVLVDRNRPIVMIVARQAPAQAPRMHMSSPGPPVSPRYGYPYGQRSLFDDDEDDEPPWRHGHVVRPR